MPDAAGASRSAFSIRDAEVGDAHAMLDYLAALTSEPGVPILLSRERVRTFTVESEQERIRGRRAHANARWLLAFDRTRVVGMLDLAGDSRPESAHCIRLGVSVAADWRGKGVGKALMNHAIEWARHTAGISRIELEVFSTNARAIRLYEQLGFAAEGVRRRAFIVDGAAVDSIVMALLL